MGECTRLSRKIPQIVKLNSIAANIHLNLGQTLLINFSRKEFEAENFIQQYSYSLCISHKIYEFTLLCYVVLCYVIYGIATADALSITQHQLSRTYTYAIAIVIMAEGKLGLKQLAQGCTCAPGNNPSRGPWALLSEFHLINAPPHFRYSIPSCCAPSREAGTTNF